MAATSSFSSGALQPFETITDGIDGADRLAIGPKYRLYVYNGGNATITAYTDGQTSRRRRSRRA